MQRQPSLFFSKLPVFWFCVSMFNFVCDVADWFLFSYVANSFYRAFNYVPVFFCRLAAPTLPLGPTLPSCKKIKSEAPTKKGRQFERRLSWRRYGLTLFLETHSERRHSSGNFHSTPRIRDWHSSADSRAEQPSRKHQGLGS